MKKLLTYLKKNEAELRNKYGISKMGVCGSFLRGESGVGSDVDLLVEFDEGAEIGLLRFVEIERQLSELLGRHVDLVEKEALKPFIGKQILKEVVYP